MLAMGFGEFLVNRRGEHITPGFSLDIDARNRMASRILPPPPEAAPAPQIADPAQPPPPEPWEDRPVKQPCGAIVGFSIASFRAKDTDGQGVPVAGSSKDVFLLEPGDELTISTVSINLQGKGVLPVQDASYFFDGYGIAGEGGDIIQLFGGGTAVVLDIDYAGNRLTLDRSLTWSAGQGVALQFSGSAPDMGAFEVAGPTNPGTAPQPPTNVRVIR